MIWYKDVFLAKIMLQNDANNSFWNEKFISGLPLFSPKELEIEFHHVMEEQFLMINIHMVISYQNAQVKRLGFRSRKELGQFCDQFAFDIPKRPAPTKNKKIYTENTKTYKKKKRKRFKGEPNKFERRKSKKVFKDIVCNNCGKKGHYANNCWSKRKNDYKKKIQELQIDEDIKRKVCELIKNSDNESSTDYPDSERLDIILESSDSNTDNSSECVECSNKIDYYKSILDMNGLSINVITNEQKFILDLIEQIEEPQKNVMH
uniref:CCHC-type domain-containing protein n=1 Tax=Lactuca sativa TaxID=4236 RepID=A0A9R1UKF1_LACSA|nr:hypothetical protein LSAT_V11C900485640 [Lactuca sativa]